MGKIGTRFFGKVADGFRSVRVECSRRSEDSKAMCKRAVQQSLKWKKSRIGTLPRVCVCIEPAYMSDHQNVLQKDIWEMFQEFEVRYN